MLVNFSQACENNKAPILTHLKNAFKHSQRILEIGSGTGQHALYFAEHLPHLSWQTSDLSINHPSIIERITTSGLTNLLLPINLDLNETWPIAHNSPFDGIFTANTLHIVSWPLVEAFFRGVDTHLSLGGILSIYGPFNYQGKFTSDSNANFDLWLKERDKQSGIRDIESILMLAKSAGLTLENDHAMPANYRLLTFKKVCFKG